MNGNDTKSDGTDTAAITNETSHKDEINTETDSGGPELNKVPMNERRRFLIQVRMILRQTVRDKFGVRFSNQCGYWLDRYMTHLVWKYGDWLDYPDGHHVLKGHSGTVFAAAMSTDGRYLFTVQSSGMIFVWDLLDYSMLKQFDSFDKSIFCLNYGRDLLVSAGESTKIRIFNGISHELIHTLEGHSACALSLRFNRECTQLLSASVDASVKIWCTKTGHCLATLTGHTNSVVSAYFLDNDTKVITGSMDNSMKVCMVDDMCECRTIMNGTEKCILDMRVNCDSSLVACCSGFKGIMIYNWPNMDMVHTVQVKAFTGQFHPSNPDILCVTDPYSKSVNICNVSSGDRIAEFEGHRYEIFGLYWSRDGSILVSVSRDRTARVWDCTALVK